ncbi:MAG: SDR family NAD(P)-dependent oxidoreductase [Bauldia sp.]
MPAKESVAIVTGGARGIGLAVVQRLMREGVCVILADNDPVAGKAAEESLKGAGPLRFMECDVTERLDIHNLLAAALDSFGRIDSLVNCAGIDPTRPFLEMTEEEFDAVLRVNLKGQFLAGQAVARHLVQRVESGGAPGAIVNLASVDAIIARPDHLAYAVSKGAVVQLTRAMAVTLAPYGIRVNAIGPGAIRTEVPAEAVTEPEFRRKKLSRVPLGRLGEPEEVAALAAFLISDEATYVTGQTVYVDGGLLPLSGPAPARG